MKEIKLAFFTQGCRLNQSETASLEQSFVKAGFSLSEFSDQTTIAVVNTCTVTENGDVDSRKLINKITRENPSCQVAMIGCQSQVLKEQLLSLKNVKWVVGNAEKMQLPDIIAETLERDDPVVRVAKIQRRPFTIQSSSQSLKQTRANLKIQDGCDFYCSFCVIPFARGPARSRVFDDLFREAAELVSMGYQELVLTGVNLGTYSNSGKSFMDIVYALEELPGLKRIRVSSIEPTTVDRRFLEHMQADTKLCRYLHLPLQSGSNAILERMRRKYQLSEFVSFVKMADNLVDDICIGTDVIVGFPGETKAHFDETTAQLLTLPIHYFHVFSYSERHYARSQRFDGQVSSELIKERSKILRTVSQKKRNAYWESFLGTTRFVLFERKKQGLWKGLTDNYIRVELESDEDLENQFRPVRLAGMGRTGVKGQLRGK